MNHDHSAFFPGSIGCPMVVTGIFCATWASNLDKITTTFKKMKIQEILHVFFYL